MAASSLSHLRNLTSDSLVRDPIESAGWGIIEQALALRDADRIAVLEGDFQRLAVSNPLGLRQALQHSFGDKADAGALDRLHSVLLSGEYQPARVQFVDASTLRGDALGAYSSDGGGTIYLDRRLLSDSDQLLHVYAEEFGHHLDAHLGGEDAAGDEGAIFARTLLDGPLRDTTLSALRSEDDHGTLEIGGHDVAVEFRLLEGSGTLNDEPVVTGPNAPRPSPTVPSPTPAVATPTAAFYVPGFGVQDALPSDSSETPTVAFNQSEAPTVEDDTGSGNSADVRSRDVRRAIEAEAAFVDVTLEPSSGHFLGTADGYERRLNSAEDRANDAWETVETSFDAEIDAVIGDTPPPLQSEARDAYVNSLDLSEFDPVYHPAILHRAGLRSAPTDLENASVRTNRAAEQTLEDQQAHDELVVLRDSLPTGLQHELDAQVAASQSQTENSEAVLSQLAVEEQRLAAQAFDAESGRDVYTDTAANIEARLIYLGLESDDASRIASGSAVEARTAEPDNLNEYRAQTNATVWDAIEAENALVEHVNAGAPSGASESELDAWESRAVELQLASDEAWRSVYFASGLELRYFAETYDGPDSQRDNAIELYSAGIHERNFPELYRGKIELHTHKPPLSDAAVASTEEVAEPYIERAEAAYATGGSDALLSELELINAEMSEDPYVIGDDTFTPSSPESDRRLADLQQLFAIEVRPLHEALADSLEADLQTILNESDDSDALGHRAVAERLERTINVLPGDLVGPAMLDTQAIWESGLAQATGHYEGGMYESDDMPTWQVEVETFRTYARISDVLVAQVGGDDAFTAMVDVVEASTVAGGNEVIAPYTRAPTPYFHPFESAASEGEGYNLMVETINRLSRDEAQHDKARDLMGRLDSGIEEFHGRVESRVTEWSNNREEFDHLILEGQRIINQENGGGPMMPGQIDVTTLDISAGLEQYLALNPDMAATDRRLMLELLDDGLSLFNLDMALGQLSPEAIEVTDAEGTLDRANEFWSDDNPIAPIFANSPLVMSTLYNQTSQVLTQEGMNPGALDLDDPDLLIQQLADNADNLNIPRNLRFMIMEWSNPIREDGRAPIPGGPLNNAFGRWSGPMLFSVASAASAVDVVFPESGADGTDRFVSGLRSVNYGYLAARDARMLSANHWFANNATHRVATWATSNRQMLGLRVNNSDGITTLTYGRLARVTPRVAFLAFDLYGLKETWNNDGLDMTRAGQWLSTAGSVTMLGEAGLAAYGLSTGPLGWIGTALWVSGTLVIFQGERVDASNRFETDNKRLFYSHFGSHDNENGQLRPIESGDEDGRGATDVTAFTDHTNDFYTVADFPNWNLEEIDGNYYETPDGDRYIIYRGLSANAVDELMNSSSSPSDPITASGVLDALAESRGIPTRTLSLEWYESLTDEQQKALPPASFGVDTESTDGVRPDFFRIYDYDNLMERVTDAMNDREPGVAPENALETFDYINEHLSYEEVDQLGLLRIELDHESVQGALGFAPMPDGVPEPGAEVRSTLNSLWFEGSDDYRIDLSPTNLAEFELWLEVKGYPALPQSEAVDVPELPERPQASVDFDYRPVEHHYTVQAGDSIWDIAERTGTPTSMLEVMHYHNLNVEPPSDNFDPQRADSDFHSANPLADPRRDPDLIEPGELLFVRDADDIAPRDDSHRVTGSTTHAYR